MSMEIMSMLLTLLFTCLAPFSASVSLDVPYTAHASFPDACLITSRDPVTRFLRLAQKLMLSPCLINRKIAFVQIHDVENQHFHPAA
jgi:hypothetical protein